MIQEILDRTFHCERFQCKLLPERCIQRQIKTNWSPEIYKGCIDCKQGLEIAQKAGLKIKSISYGTIPILEDSFRIMKCPNCKKAELELIYYEGNPDYPIDVCPLCGYCLNVFNMERDFLDELYWEDTEGFDYTE